MDFKPFSRNFTINLHHFPSPLPFMEAYMLMTTARTLLIPKDACHSAISLGCQIVKNTETNPTGVDYQALSRIATHISDHFGPFPGTAWTAGRTSLHAARHI